MVLTEEFIRDGVALHTLTSRSVSLGSAATLLCFQREVPDGTPILVTSRASRVLSVGRLPDGAMDPSAGSRIWVWLMQHVSHTEHLPTLSMPTTPLRVSSTTLLRKPAQRRSRNREISQNETGKITQPHKARCDLMERNVQEPSIPRKGQRGGHKTSNGNTKSKSNEGNDE